MSHLAENGKDEEIVGMELEEGKQVVSANTYKFVLLSSKHFKLRVIQKY